jgi:rhamnogalacturonan endolyase
MLSLSSWSACNNTPAHRFRPSNAFCVASLLLSLLYIAGCGNSGDKLATLSPALAFNALTTTPSAAQNATLTNIGLHSVAIKSVTITGTNAANFAETTTCGKSLPPGTTCNIAVTFASNTAGPSSAFLTVIDDGDGGGTLSVQLSGTSVAPAPAVSVSAPSVTFPAITAGSASSAQTVTITDSGTASLNLSSIAITGPGANLFSDTTTCGATLAVGASCNISATFTPKIPGSYSASIALTDSAGNSPQSIPLTGTASPAALAIDTTTATDWKISNGVLNLDWNSKTGRIFGITLAGFPDQLVDVTSTSGGQPQGFYMDNSGLGSGTTTATYTNAGNYLDWSITTASNSANAYTYTEHFIITPNDPGIHVYFVANHAATDIAGSIGQVQWVYRENLNDFTSTYSVNADLSNPGPVIVPLAPASENFSTDPGRAVQDATVDLHGLPVPAGFARSFYTKYDYSSYNYLHQAHGVFGSNIGVWGYFHSNESLVGGPTKQNLIYTGNLLILEAYSNHYDNNLSLATPSGTASSRLFGPFYVHFNTIGEAYDATGNLLTTPGDMYQDAVQAGAASSTLYDAEQQLLENGYIPSNARGTVSVQVNGVTGAAHTAWAVLSDSATNFEFSSKGNQYWADISNTGSVTFNGVAPGTYRLSTYVLGQWGELRKDNIVVTANQATTVPPLTFVPENFSTTSPVFTIGTADRSSHEFLHGHDAAGHDDREFWGNWNYWGDFQANQGAVIYNATAGPAGAATNDPSQWNYTHWGIFSPGLYGGVYSASDDTTDGYKYIVPSYASAYKTMRTPNWQVHFATPATQTGSTASSYVVLSVALACAEGSYVVTLNGQQLVWHEANPSDCMVRSGLSGYTQWVAFQWDSTVLNPAGQDNLLAVNVSQTDGVSDDALRLELTNTSADPAVRGWNDYEYVYKTTDTKPNDAVSNP